MADRYDIPIASAPFAVAVSGSLAMTTSDIVSGNWMSLKPFSNFSLHPFGRTVPPLKTMGMA